MDNFNLGNPFASVKGRDEKLAVLRTLSLKCKQTQKLMEQANADIIPRVNDLLIDMYRQSGADEFNSYRGWLKKGKQVKRGAKAYVVWSNPQKMKDRLPDGTEVESEEEYFFMAHLFSDKQVQ